MGPAVCKDASSCHLHVGAVVRYVGDRPEPRAKADRGVVVEAHAREGVRYGITGPLTAGDAIIDLGPGHTRVTNMHRQWELVPDAEQTTVERIRSNGLRWVRPDWHDDADEQVPERDSWTFALLRGLLTPFDEGEVFGEGDWPCSIYELVAAVAHRLDEERVPGVPSQVQTLAWVAERWPDKTDAIWRAAKLGEEAGEVLGAVIKRDEGRTTLADIRMETAQVVICAMALAESVGFDLRRAVADEYARATSDPMKKDSSSTPRDVNSPPVADR